MEKWGGVMERKRVSNEWILWDTFAFLLTRGNGLISFALEIRRSYYFFFLSVSSHEVTKSLREFYLGEANIRWKEYKVILVVKYHKIKKKKKNVINARQ